MVFFPQPPPLFSDKPAIIRNIDDNSVIIKNETLLEDTDTASLKKLRKSIIDKSEKRKKNVSINKMALSLINSLDPIVKEQNLIKILAKLETKPNVVYISQNNRGVFTPLFQPTSSSIKPIKLKSQSSSNIADTEESNSSKENSKKTGFFVEGLALPRNTKGKIVGSRIRDNKALVKHAEAFKNTNEQKLVNNLVAQLDKGNVDPGIGTHPLDINTHIDIFEARGKNGVRVYFGRDSETGDMTILAKSTKKNQDKVIKLLEKMYNKNKK